MNIKYLDPIVTVNDEGATQTTPDYIKFAIEESGGKVLAITKDFGDDTFIVYQNHSNDLTDNDPCCGVIMIFMDGFIHADERNLTLHDALTMVADLIYTDLINQ